MRYLPNDSITDELWAKLRPLICEKVGNIRLLESWSSRDLHKLSNLKRLTKDFLNQSGSPLPPDIEGSEVYLSLRYNEADFRILQGLSLRKLRVNSFLDRLQADLDNSRQSKWRTTEDFEWRNRICKILLACWREDSPT